jgi:hypothetical protein
MAVFFLLACLSFFALIALVKIGSRPLDFIDLDAKRIPAHMAVFFSAKAKVRTLGSSAPRVMGL